MSEVDHVHDGTDLAVSTSATKADRWSEGRSAVAPVLHLVVPSKSSSRYLFSRSLPRHSPMSTIGEAHALP